MGTVAGTAAPSFCTRSSIVLIEPAAELLEQGWRDLPGGFRAPPARYSTWTRWP